MNLRLLPETLTVCQLPAAAPIPEWATRATGFVSITRTADELSIVCAADAAPKAAKQESGWRAFKVEGPLDFALTGILASLAGPLARAGVAIFSVATYNTDYILVKTEQVDTATQALQAAGHVVKPA